MHITILTDIPVWVRSLQQALESLGAELSLCVEPGNLPKTDLVVNRISTRVASHAPEQVEPYLKDLKEAEVLGLPVVNGSGCFEVGLSKFKQFESFQALGLKTPRTASIDSGKRAFPESKVLLKPQAGGFGKGIIALGSKEELPDRVLAQPQNWVEQERITPADGQVHRVEILGPKILYRASTPLEIESFNYCLARRKSEAQLSRAEAIPAAQRDQVQQVAKAIGLELGAIEYFVNQAGEAIFFDINPVSSLHPEAQHLLGEDLIHKTASYLFHR